MHSERVPKLNPSWNKSLSVWSLHVSQMSAGVFSGFYSSFYAQTCMFPKWILSEMNVFYLNMYGLM